jgi:glucose/mannose-6-phosphate isomerase
MNPADPSNMHDMIANFPAQFALGIEWAKHITLTQPITTITVTGMGGSALPSDLFNIVFVDALPHPLTVSRTYTLPKNSLGAKNLVIACSFSGNTEETIAAYQQAVASGNPTVVIAGGGKLIELAEKQGTPFVLLKKESPNFQPRMGSGYFFGALTMIAVAAGWLPETALEQILSDAKTLGSFDSQTLGQSLVSKLHNKIPCFYTPDHLMLLARVAKIKVNENAKVPAFWNYLPEANHNEMVGFSRADNNFLAVMLKDPGADPKSNLRFDIMAKVLKSTSDIDSVSIDLWGNTIFTKVFSTLMTIDWASYYLALEDNVDPTPVDMVEDFKRQIESAAREV